MWKTALQAHLINCRPRPLGVILAVVFSFTLSACARGIQNPNLLSNISGQDTITILGGNNQSALPSENFQLPLTVQVTDTLTGTPLSNTAITYTEITRTGATISTPTVFTSSDGIAKTYVIAPATYNQVIQIVATIQGNQGATSFLLNTSSANGLYTFAINTTHNLVETAANPFGYILSVTNNQGSSSGSPASNIDGTYSFSVTLTTNHAWAWNGLTSTDYNQPDATFSCTFNAGTCVTPIDYTLTDSTRSTLILFSEQTGIIPGGSATIEVVPNIPSFITLASALGGPSAGAIAYATAVETTAGTATTIAAAVVDTAGNYLSDTPASTTWSVNPSSYLSPTTGTTISFNSTVAGNGTFDVSDPSLPQVSSATVPLYVDPGAAASMTIGPGASAPSTLLAGQAFPLTIQVLDAHGNVLVTHHDGTSGFNGTYPTTLSFDTITFSPDVSQGCNRFHLSGDNTYSSPVACGTRTLNLTFANGTLTSDLSASLNYAYENYSNNQTITASIASPSIVGTSSSLRAHLGPAERIELHTSAANNGSFLLTQEQYEAQNNVWVDAPGAAASTYYAIVTDVAGNYISNATVSWSASGAFAGEFSPISGTSSTFTPTVAGQGSLTLTYNGINSTYTGLTNSNPIDHFIVAISDGVNATNTIDVTKNLSLTLTAQDSYGNPVAIATPIPLTITATGTTTSPIGTSPNLPSSGSYTLTNGAITWTTTSGNPLRIPNATNTVNISVSALINGTTYYSKPSSTVGAASATTYLTPTLKYGSVDLLQILSSSNNTGSNYTSSPTTLPHGSSPTTFTLPSGSSGTLYLNTYDSEGNFLNSTTPGTWSWSNSSIASLSSSSQAASNSLTASATGVGNGTLSVNYTTSAGVLLTATVSSVNIGNDTPTQLVFTVEPPASTTAGITLSPAIQVSMEDSSNNVISILSGTITLSINTGPTGGTFAGGSVITAGMVSGVASFNQLTFDTAGTYTLAANTTVNSGGPIALSGTSTSFQITPKLTATQIGFNVQPTNTIATSQISPAVVVAIEDTYGNTVTNASAPITLTIGTNPPGTATLIGTATITATNGLASFTNLQITTEASGYTLVANSSGFTTATSSTFNITGGASDHFSLVTPPTSSVTAGVNFATSPSIVVVDTYGNTVSSSVDVVTLSPFSDSTCTTPGTGVLRAVPNPQIANGTTGIASFVSMQYNTNQTIYLLASSSTVAHTTCFSANPVTVLPNTNGSLTFSTQPSTTATAGVAFATQPIVQALDSYGNLATTNTDTVTLAAFTDSQCTSPATASLSASPTTLAGGIASFTGANFQGSGTIYLQASTAALVSACSNGIILTSNTVNSTASTLITSSNSVSADGSSNIVITITLKDTYGNLTPNQPITLSTNRGPLDNFVLAPSTTNAAGVAVFNLNSTLPGISQITAVANGSVTLSTTPSVQFLGATPLIDLQAALATGSGPGSNSVPTSSWSNLANGGSTHNGSLTSFAYTTADGWNSTVASAGTLGTPYALTFNGSTGSSYVTLGTSMKNYNDATLEVWAQPTNLPTAIPTPATLGAVVMGNGYPVPGSTASPAPTPAGMTLRQSAIYSGKMQLTIGGGSYVDEVISDAPVGYWRLDETSGTTAHDYSGNGHIGTYTGGYVQGQSGALLGDTSTSASFNGTTGYVQIGPAGLPTGASARSIEAWIKPNSLPSSGNQNAFVSYGSGSTDNGQGVGIENVSGTQSLSYNGFGGGTATAVWAYTTSTSSWTHIVATYDGTNALIYANGSPIGSPTATPWNTTLGSNSLVIGAPAWAINSGFNYAGNIQDVAIYSTALSASRIAAHYAARLRSTCLTSSAVTNSAWHLFDGAFASSSSTLSLFMDGKQQCSVSNPQVAYNGSSSNLNIAADTNSTPSNFFQGLISDFRTYTSALSSTAISKNFYASAQRGFPSGAVMWLKADAGTLHGSAAATSGTSVSTWVDQSGYTGANHGNATGGVSPTYAANAANGYPAVNFNGTSQYLLGPSVFPTSADYSIIAVPSFSNLTNTNNIISASDTGHAFFLNGTAYLNLYQNGSFATSTIPVTTSTFYVLSSTYQQSNSAGTVFINGAQGGSGTASNSNTNNTIYIGNDTTGAYTLAGSMAEAFVFSSALSSSTRSFIENYLMQKYGIASPAYQLAFTTQPENAYNGAALTPSVVVTVEDRDGNVVPSYSSPITLAIGTNPGSGTLSGTATITPSNGIATFSNMSINKDGTGYTLTATSGTLVGATSSSFNVWSNSATQLAFVAQPAQTVAGQMINTVTVALEDSNGNTATNSTATITMSIATNPGGGALAGTVTVVTSNGTANFSTLVIDMAGVGYTLEAQSGGFTPATSSAFTVTPGTANKLSLTIQPSSAGTAGINLTQPPTITVEDTYGNVVTSSADSVTLQAFTDAACSSIASGTLSAASNPLAATNGIVSFTNVNYTIATPIYLKAISATVTNASPCSNAISINPNAANKLAYKVPPSTSIAGSTMPVVEVIVEDTYGNTATSYSASITIAIGTTTAGAVLSGTATVSTVNSIATFSNLSVNKAFSSYTLTATGGGLTSVTSSAFAVLSNVGTQLSFTTQPTNSLASPTPLNAFAVTVLDSNGNTVTNSGAVITVAIGTNPSGGTLSAGVVALTGANLGVASFANSTINLVGTGYTLVASSEGMTSATSNAFNVSYGTIDPKASLVTAYPMSVVTAGNSVVTVTLKDADGNLITTAQSVTFTSSEGNVTFNPASGIVNTNGSGVGVVTVTSSTLSSAQSPAGPAVITAQTNNIVLASTPNILFLDNAPQVDLQALMAQNAHGPATNIPAITTWLDLSQASSPYSATLFNFLYSTSNGWSGDGVASHTGAGLGPYNLTFDGSADYTLIGPNPSTGGTGISSLASMTFETWIKPSSTSTRGSVILGNGDSNQRGLTIEQSPIITGAVEVHTGYRSYVDEVMADSPITYWRLNETSGTAVTDYSGNGNTGNYNGGYTLNQTGALTGTDNNAASVSLNGTTGYVIGSQTVNIALATVEAWIYPTAYPTSTYGELVGFMNGEGTSQSDKELVMDTSGYLYFYAFDGSFHYTSTPSSTVPLNQWSHIVGTADGTHIYVYLNGNQIGSTTCGNTATNYTAPNIVVGGTTVSNSRNFYGSAVRFDDISVYNTALSASRILAHYNARTQPVCRTSSVLTNGTWSYIAASLDNTAQTLKLFFNGTQQCTITPSTAFSAGNTANPLAAGAMYNSSSASKYFAGSIADIRVYPTPVATSAITDNYNATKYKFSTSDTPVGISLANSTITVSPSSILKNQTATLTLTARDSYGNLLTSGGSVITFTSTATEGGTPSTGSIGATTDNSNGTYTATFTASSGGTALTISAKSGGENFAATATLTIYNGPTNSLYGGGAGASGTSGSGTSDNVSNDSTYSNSSLGTPPSISQGSSITLISSGEVGTAGNNLTLSCTYQTLGLSTSDPNYAASGTNCTSLPTLALGTNGSLYLTTMTMPSASTNPSLSWTPTSTQRGTYQFSLTSSDGTLSTTSGLTLTIDDAVNSINLTSNLLRLSFTGSGNVANGTLLTDSSPYANSFTANVSGTMAYVSGAPVNNSIYFNGASYLSGPTSSTFNAYPLTVLTWINTTQSTTSAGIINKVTSSTPTGWDLHLTSGAPCLTYAVNVSNYVSTSGTCASNTVNDGNWHLIAAVVNTAGTTLYVDGVSSTFAGWTGTASAPTSSTNLSIGYGTSGTYFNGNLAEILVFDRALSAAEIASAYSTTNLLSGFDALISSIYSGLTSPSAPTLSSTPYSWENILTYAPVGYITGTNAAWQGTGQSSSSTVNPYALNFPGTAALSAGSAISSGINKLAIEAWAKPAAPTSAGAVIASNAGPATSGTTIGGMSLRQSLVPTGRAELAVGEKYFTYRDLVLSDQPIAFWRLSETSGTTAADLTSYRDTGSYVGTPGTNYTLNQTGPLTGSGDNSPSVNFDGSGNGYVQIASPTPIPTGAAPRSIEAWIYPTSLPASGSLYCYYGYGSGSGSNGQGGCIRNISGILYMTYTGFANDANLSYPSISTNTWYHVVDTFDGTVAAISVNGSPIGTYTPTTWNTVLNANGFEIGTVTWLTAQYFPGKIADVAIYNYALSATQIANHYSAGTTLASGPAYPANAVLADHAVSYWRLGEKQGNIAYDYSSNSNNGTYVGTYTLGQSGALTSGGDMGTSTNFDGSSAVVALPTPIFSSTSALSIEAWIKPSSTSGTYDIVGRELSFKLQQVSNSNYAFLLSTNGTTWSGGSIGGGSPTINTWAHLVGVYNGTNTYLYVNGSQVAAGSLTGPIASTTNQPGIGKVAGYFPGNIAEVAYYNYALSPTQVTVHYNSGKGSGWWLCQSQTQLSSSNWNFFSALYDGTNAKLYTNGQLECSVQPGTTFTGASSNTQIAASPNDTSYWSGLLNLLKIFGTSNGVTNPLPTPLPQNEFAATANRFRQQPIENIVVDDSLVLHLDPANAYQGTQPYVAGTCPTTTWFDLSSSANNGTLSGFTSCTSSNGWSGTGTTTSPYALTFNGTTDTVTLPTTLTLNTAGITIAAWYETSSSSTMILVSTGSSGAMHLAIASPGGGFTAQACLNTCFYGPTSNNYTNGNWHYMAATVNSGGNGTLYVDGTSVSTTSGLTISAATSPMLGNQTGDSFYFNGSMGPVQIYNRALTGIEINQNCNAQKSRFSSATCAAP